jgi:hypothetical protein
MVLVVVLRTNATTIIYGQRISHTVISCLDFSASWDYHKYGKDPCFLLLKRVGMALARVSFQVVVSSIRLAYGLRDQIVPLMNSYHPFFQHVELEAQLIITC